MINLLILQVLNSKARCQNQQGIGIIAHQTLKSIHAKNLYINFAPKKECNWSRDILVLDSSIKQALAKASRDDRRIPNVEFGIYITVCMSRAFHDKESTIIN